MNGSGRRFLGLAVVLTGCILPVDVTVESDGSDPQTVRGSGRAVTVSRPVEGFERIVARGVGRVVVERTGRERLRLTADDNLVRHFESEVRDGTLYLGPRSGIRLEPRTEPVFRVEAASLERLAASGAIVLEADVGTQPGLEVVLGGVCTITTWGAVDRLELGLSGVTGYRGLSLRSRTATVLASGASWAEVWVTRQLHADASGTSTIRYSGEPVEVVAHTSGLGSVGPY